MTATDLDTMHRAVLLDPADDVARLAFADACEEAGLMANARFVRNWVSLPGKRLLDVEAGRESWWDATGRGVRGSEDRHDLIVPPGCHRATWCRGFVEAVALSLAAFMRHAKELFGRHPITAVTLTDRDFSYAYWVSSGRAVCSGPGYESHGFYIPYQIFRRLKGATTISPGFRGYATAELAHAALSAGCVAYGRRLAGLPPLPEART